jgi:hypothetical protein
MLNSKITTSTQPSDTHEVITLNSLHEESIIDCQTDHYGTQLVSCDSNGFL